MDVHRTRGRPTALIVGFHQTEFIDPHLTRLHLTGDIPHTDHHHLHLSECRVTQDADLIGWLGWVEGGIKLVVGSLSHRLQLVTLFLQVGKHVETDVEHIINRPHQLAVGIGVLAVVAAVRRQHKRYLVFVVVVLVVITQTDEHRQLPILQGSRIRQQVVGMHEHLHPLILAQVDGGLLIHCLRLVLLQVVHNHLQRLFVALHQLRLTRICHTTDAWRQHVVHGLLVVVLLDVHGIHGQCARFGTTRTKTLLIDTPLTPYEVETAETEHNGLLETRHVHTHETDAGEVADAAFPALILYQGHTELIPVHRRGVAITQFHVAGTHVGDVTVLRGYPLTVGFENLITDAYLVLEVVFKLVHREVLIDILHIRTTLITGVVGFRLFVGVR